MNWEEISTFVLALNNIQLLLLVILAVVVIIVLYKSKDLIANIYYKKSGKTKKQDACVTLAIDEAVNKALKIWTIKKIDIVDAQMQLIERLAEKCKNILMDDMKEMTNDYREIRAYDKILEVAFRPVVKSLRTWVVKNNLTGREETVFRIYVDDTVGETIETASASIDDHYFDEDFSIKRVALKKKNLELSGRKLQDTIEKTLYDLRKVSKYYEGKIAALRN